jgi:protein phosphatase 1 regulatory subunit 7
LVNLEELYLQQNQIKKIEGLNNNLQLETLDIAVNKIVKLEGLAHLPRLTELWINWNAITDDTENREYLKTLKLKTIYLADNPVANHDEYEEMLKTAIPTLQQIDGNHLRLGGKFYH